MDQYWSTTSISGGWLYLVAHFFGIASERRLMKEVQVNLAYRWFVGYDLGEDLPDHSVLTKARARFPGSLFAGIFARVLGLCRARGLISGDMHLVDSSLIHADASNESFSRCLPPFGDFIDGLDSGTTGGGHRKRSCAFDGTVDPKRMRRHREKAKKSQVLSSSTDPDAQLVTRSGKGSFAAYNAHLLLPGRVTYNLWASVWPQMPEGRMRGPILSISY